MDTLTVGNFTGVGGASQHYRMILPLLLFEGP